MKPTDRYNLDRFLSAQDRGGVYHQAITEIRRGRKVTHWIWFVLPRLIGPGYSTMSEYYALENRWAARAYLKHPVLGQRLLRCVEAVLMCRHRTLLEIFGPVDEPKVRQTAELFASLNEPDSRLFLHLLCKR